MLKSGRSPSNPDKLIIVVRIYAEHTHLYADFQLAAVGVEVEWRMNVGIPNLSVVQRSTKH